ncbi:MAG: mechanosensitive ion channel family protein [Alloprevotella sp.]
MEILKTWIEEWISAMGASEASLNLWVHGIMVCITALLALLADWTCVHVFVPIANKVTSHTETLWDDMLLNEKVVRSACHIIPAIVVWWLLPMTFTQYPMAQEAMARITAIYITVMTLRTAQCVIAAVAQMDSDRRSSAQQYFHTFCGVLRIVFYLVAVVVVIAIIIGRNPLTVIAGLGATSAVLMLVFKDTIEGLVAGIRLTSNDMMHIGDWITVPQAGADGTVVGMSLTTVKIRNFDNTIITVSPKALVDNAFRNWKGMQQADGRRVARKLLFEQHSISRTSRELRQRLVAKGYFDSEELQGESINMQLYRTYMERFVEQRKEVNRDMTLMVRQMEPTPYGMPLEFYFFLHNKEWKSYEHQMAEIMEWAIVIAADFDLKIYEVQAVTPA